MVVQAVELLLTLLGAGAAVYCAACARETRNDVRAVLGSLDQVHGGQDILARLLLRISRRGRDRA